ncbi:glycoside hydrolase family 28 protein [Pseudomassariella vexata]|uniref:Glycoside hydrolase family 28 protein n=1 Tax=Pseudomassariella vexata TaxID=1141098 RepID=A0A1Y2DJ47_9PEZI|nr:glycoside hydrolase family 28 protein [Pseudomassariella vexata]ORY58835.1 glycoside hydrolase family 28 protein [Pseudomassariella vexata]
MPALLSILPAALLFAAKAQGLVTRASSAADATCTPASGTNDDAPAIAAAFSSCFSGTIVIPAGKTYNIGSVLSWTGCAGCTLQLDGTLNVSTNLTYWNGKSEIFSIANINGATIYSSTGTGVIEGNGQASWDYIVDGDTSYDRPNLIRVDGTTNLKMYNLEIRNSPQFHVVTSGNSKDIYYGDITLYAVSTSNNVAHNTDGFDVGPASYVTLENLHVTNGDDCVVLKPGADNIVAREITCIGSHGLSVGSLGSSYGKTDSVTNSIFEGAYMSGATKAGGVKVWPAGPDHGSAVVSNVTWRDIYCDGCQYALQIESCYSEDDSYCEEYPSTAQLTNVVWQNVTGVTDGKYDDVVGNLNCPGAGTCGISVSELSVKSPDGGQTVLCANTDGDIGVTCTNGASG